MRLHALFCFLLIGTAHAANLGHFKPEAHVLGDVHPFIREGECYLYYLTPGKYESTLVRSRDWRTWEPVPLTHEPVTSDDWMSPYFVLGVFRDEQAQVYRSFYGHAKGRMASSISTDLTHWSCAPKAFHVPESDYYERRRDPFVFWMPDLKQYGCVMTTWMKGRSKERGGAISLATSPDLQQWTDHGAIIDPGDIGEPECPQMFALGGRWYVLASIYDRAVGAPTYWSSASPLGPWSKTPAGQLDGKDLCAAQIAFDGDKPVLFGWVPLLPARPGKQTWGGHLALPRDLRAEPDGKLSVRLTSKHESHLRALPWQSLPEVSASPTKVTCEGSCSTLATDFTVKLEAEAKELRVSVSPLGEFVLRRDRLLWRDAHGEAWSELAVDLHEPSEMKVQLFMDGDIAEAFVADRYSLVARLPATKGALSLGFQTDADSAQIRSLKAANWATPP